jgi:hypothetical protein
MTLVTPNPIIGQSIWSAEEISHTDDWIVHSSAVDVIEIKGAHDVVKRN